LITVTVPLFSFARVLWNAALFASKDEERPILQTLRLRFERDPREPSKPRVSALACDSYRSGYDYLVTDAPCPRLPSGPTDYLLWADECADIARLLKKLPRPDLGEDEPTVNVYAEETCVTIEHGPTRYTLGTYTESLFPLTLESIFGEFEASAEAEIRFSPTFLGEYKRLLVDDARTVKYAVLTLRFGGGTKPSIVTVGESFEGLLSPMRPPDANSMPAGAEADEEPRATVIAMFDMEPEDLEDKPLSVCESCRDGEHPDCLGDACIPPCACPVCFPDDEEED
jgi:hypothetical protein